MNLDRNHVRRILVGAGALGLIFTTAGCSGGAGDSGSSASGGDADCKTIRVALAADPLPESDLAAFTKDTGITVKWTNLDWDSLQTKITSAATANSYFADATNVDWSRVGQLGQLDWFYPLGDYLDTASMAEQMPQLDSFTYNDQVIGVPYTASFMVTTINQELFAQAGITEMPGTFDEYTAALEELKSQGVVEYPLNIPFAAAEGLSTYWYQTTAAFGGEVLDEDGKPTFASPDSAGYKAAEWMVGTLESELVPPGNINTTDSQGREVLMAQGQVATTFSDYAGSVGSLYQVPGKSTVVDKVVYVPTPGVDGASPNLNNPDGVGIPRQATCPDEAAEFIEWFTSADLQAKLAGAKGAEGAWPGYSLPSQLDAVEQLAEAGVLTGGAELKDMLENSAQPVFPNGAPSWYPEFSRTVYTSLHAAAAGEMSVEDAIATIAETAESLASDS